MKMRGWRGWQRPRPYALHKRYLNPGDVCYSFDSKGNILELKVLETIDWTHRVKGAAWRTGAVYYFVEGIPNESALGEEIFLSKPEARNAFKSHVTWLIKESLNGNEFAIESIYDPDNTIDESGE